MSSVQFQYEIPVDEYVAAQVLYHRLFGRDRRIGRAACWILVGAVFVVMAFNSRPPAWAPYDTLASLPLVLLAAIGIWWMCAGIQMLYPTRYFRRAYRSFEFVGKSFQADADENGFHITGEFFEWRVKWPAVRLKGEDERVFMFVAGGTVYIFGKKFLSSDQQQELRRISGLKS